MNDSLREALEEMCTKADRREAMRREEGSRPVPARVGVDVLRSLLAANPNEPAPVEAARDAYSDQMNLELRQSIAANVLEAMDVDQYLIDAVRNAVPAESADEWARLDAANADTDAMADYVPKEKVRDVVEFLRSRSKDEAIGTADTRWAYMRAANCVADTLLPEKAGEPS